jgi:hypothetical protein
MLLKLVYHVRLRPHCVIIKIGGSHKLFCRVGEGLSEVVAMKPLRYQRGGASSCHCAFVDLLSDPMGRLLCGTSAGVDPVIHLPKV